LNIQKTIWRPSVKIFQGGITYPVTELGGDPLFSAARTGDDFDISFALHCFGGKREYTSCKVNSYTFSVTAGDFCQVNADIMATKGQEVAAAPIVITNRSEEKIVTWDALNVSITGGSNYPIQSITFTINNNCKPVYTAGANTLLKLRPGKIRVGMQNVTGSIAYYNEGKGLSFLEDISEPNTIRIFGGGISISLNVLFKPQERQSAIGPVISTLPFVGVDYALGEG
jgi:hypothetical protein